MAGLERLGEGLERVWKGFGKGDGGAWTAWHEVLDKALALSRSEKLIQDASRVTCPARLVELRNREGGRIGKCGPDSLC